MSDNALYAEFLEHLERTPTIDTHEHLPEEAARLEVTPDFSFFFCFYCQSDLRSAGMPETDAARFFAPGTPLDEKWKLFEPYYRRIEGGSYCRSAHIAMDRFYGYARLHDFADAEGFTAALRAANTPGLYARVLRDACNIRLALNFGGVGAPTEFFRYVPHVNQYTLPTKPLIRQMEEKHGGSCGSLNGYVDALWHEMQEAIETGCAGFKFSLAYERDLSYAPRTHHEAEQVFLRVMEESYGWRLMQLGYDEMRPLQDYLVHRMIEMAIEFDVPVIFHTGLQTMIEHKPSDARPAQLWNLAHRYPQVRLILLHAGFPWFNDAALLAKHYPNVYLDMAWTWLMSPELSTQALKAFVDLLPMNKVLGFGGDLGVVEKVYGHLTLARQGIARALAQKVGDGLPKETAHRWMDALMYDNPKRVYHLDV